MNNINGVTMPYLALFDYKGDPILNPITGVPLGAYITSFLYTFDEEHENQAKLLFHTGEPDIVDTEGLQHNDSLIIQWGYIFPDGTSNIGVPHTIKVKDYSCKFTSTGVQVEIICIDGTSDLRHLPGIPPFDEEDPDNMVRAMDNGFGYNVGIIIEEFAK